MGSPAERDQDALSWLGHVIVRSAGAPAGGPALGALAVVATTVGVFGLGWAVGPELSTIAVAAIAVVWISWRFPLPFGLVAAVANAVAGVVVTGWHPESRADLLVTIANGVFRMGVLVALAAGTTFLRVTLQVLDRGARFDSLTGLLNRRSFFELAERERAVSARRDAPLTVAYIDLDGLKRVNDQQGHDAGDDFIVRFAEALRRSLRAVDLVARLGGDEFVLLLPDTDGATAVAVMERIQAEPHTPRASVGLATWPTQAPAVEIMVTAADKLMYRAKKAKTGLHAETMGTSPAR